MLTELHNMTSGWCILVHNSLPPVWEGRQLDVRIFSSIPSYTVYNSALFSMLSSLAGWVLLGCRIDLKMMLSKMWCHTLCRDDSKTHVNIRTACPRQGAWFWHLWFDPANSSLEHLVLTVQQHDVVDGKDTGKMKKQRNSLKEQLPFHFGSYPNPATHIGQ